MRTALLPVLAIAAALAGGCRGEAPPPPAPVSSWTAGDSQAVAVELVDALVKQPWNSQFRDRNGRSPRIAVGAVDDRSGDHVDTGAFAGALAARLADSGKVAVVAGAEPADYTLAGVVTMTSEAKDGQATNYFRVSLRLVDAAGKEDPPPVGLERAVVPAAPQPSAQPPAR